MTRARRNNYTDRLLRVLRHVQLHLDDDLALDDLAAIACVSPFHFHRVFAALMGETVGAHIRRLRLERAARALRAGETAITAAAFDARYESVEAFSRAFRAAYGSPPSLYRRRQHCYLQLPAPSGVHWRPDGAVARLCLDNQRPEDDPMNVRYETIGDVAVAAIRHIGPYRRIGEAFGKLDRWGSARKMFEGAPWVIAIYHDDPSTVPEDKLRSDACVQAPADFKGDGEVKRAVVPAGRYAVKLHRGRYEALGDAWNGFIRDWAIKNGIEIDNRPCFERYLNTPRDVAPEDLVTDLYLPVKG